jgi:hypothetical protein
MKKIKSTQKYLFLIAILCVSSVVGCSPPTGDVTPPTVVSTYPINSTTGVASNGTITATFSEAMDTATIVAVNFTVMAGATSVTGTVTYDLPNKTAIFAPTNVLAFGTVYTATITTGAKDLADNALIANTVWTFTTAPAGLGPVPVRLGTSGNFAILAKTGISTVPASVITGDIGVSPAAETYLTGFSQTKATGYSTSPQVIGFMYAADMTPPTPSNMTTAISDMQAAYTDAAGRTLPDHLNLAGGTLPAGTSLAPGLYKWGSTVHITGNVTISGAANDVWIFQMTGDLNLDSGFSVVLAGGAQAKNIVWQVAGLASLGTTSHFEGIILSQTSITLQTNATMNGRALAQTNVALDQTTITKPAL